ncbi:phage portal protein [Xanthobacter autotrophicus]|uniref:phage portal protein n=1 Tax=Xanthobacter TaxID=279 RepID=UPI0024AB4FE0|nr:phage portal protein [Xanthobacter autotrophicus]MDI4664335.1 phage portal protein [Xanthobacter autotrophicus]
MGILDFWPFPRQQVTETKAAPSLPAPPQPSTGNASWLFFGTPSPDGKLHINVTPDTAMKCPPVRRAISVLSSAVSTMPLHLYKRGDSNSKSRATDHPLYKVLHRRANEFMSASHFREIMMRNALLHGNAYALINRNEYFTELWHIPPNYVRVEYDELTYAPVYFVRHGGGAEETTYPASAIFHIRNTGACDYVGDSPVNECQKAIMLSMLLEEHGKLFFENMARPSGMILMLPGMPETTLDNARKAWMARTAGGNMYGTPMMPGVQDYKPISFSSVDAQFLETRKEQVVEIARVFGVPPHSLFEMGRATWDNITAERQEFLDGSLSDWLTRWEDEIYMKLLTPDEQEEYFAEFLTDNFLRMNPLDRAEAQGKRIASRILSPNEARAQENLPPYEGGDEFINPNTTSSTIPDNTNADKPA